MKITSALARVCLLTLSLALPPVHADVLLDMTDHLTAANSTQLGRLSRNGVPQDWAGTELYPGAINPGTTYHYKTYAVNVGSTRYVQIFLDASGNAAGGVFSSVYLTSYDPNNKATNWKGDAGSSGNFFAATDPNFFNVLVPANSTIVVVINETSAAALNQNYRLIIEGYLDAAFTPKTACAPGSFVCKP
jgi:hypothetical protein